MLKRFNIVHVMAIFTILLAIGLPLVAHARTTVKVAPLGGGAICPSLTNGVFASGPCVVYMEFDGCQNAGTETCTCILNGIQHVSGDCSGALLGDVWTQFE